MAMSIENISDVTTERLDEARAIVEKVRVTSDCNSLYYQNFSLLRLAGLSAEIPRLVVLGQQSMGKTTLLDYIMGGPIGYSSTETGTKQPVVISIAPSDDGSTRCKFFDKEMDLAQLQDTISEKMVSAGDMISKTELLVEVFIPGSVHAIFVDLPGIKDDSKEGATITKKIVRDYVKRNPNDLYILVKKTSDDPANWSYKLKDFIVGPAPNGLGLDRAQTIVVGTRAKEFLEDLKSDVKTQEKLLERVMKRAVYAQDGQPMKLFLLELFSLSLETKNLPFAARRNEMQKQIRKGHGAVNDLLEYFTPDSPEIRNQLYKYFDDKLFKKELNTKFQSLLNNQLKALEDRIRNKARKIEQERKMKSRSLELLNPTSFMENIRTFVRLLAHIATALLAGEFPVVKFEHDGISFLNEFGGTLDDNLRDGHQLAMQLFPPNQYDYESLKRYLDKDRIMYVRFVDNNNVLFGKIILDEKTYGPFDSTSGLEHKVLYPNDSFERTVPANNITEIVPLELLATKFKGKSLSLKCWEVSTSDDDQATLAPVNVTADFSQVTDDSADSDAKIRITYTPTEEQPQHPISLQSLFIDYSDFVKLSTNERNTPGPSVSSSKLHSRNSSQSEYNAKLLNKIPISDLSEWLKDKLMESNPDKRFADVVALQMMRRVHLVQDKLSYESLVADVLQFNVRRHMLNLSILACCALAVHLRRVIKAAFAEMCRRAEVGKLDHALIRLVKNRILMDDLESGLENYCKNKARECVKLMEKDILYQTYAVRFDVISQFFSECCKYEGEFLNTNTMEPVVKSVRKNLDERTTFPEVRSGKLSLISDSEAQHVLMREVRMQYWIAKFILSQTLSTMAYVHFEQDLLDKTEHLADDFAILSTYETSLEREMQQELLDNITTDCKNKTDLTKEQRDKMLMDHFGLGQELENLNAEEVALGRVHQFLEYTLEAVTKLRGQTLTKNGVDFLIQLSDESNTGLSSRNAEIVETFSISETSAQTQIEEYLSLA